MYQLIFSKEADKTLRKMPRSDAQRIREKLDQLTQDPFAPNNNVTKLQNREGYRLRAGNWRVIYIINNDLIHVFVVKNAPRGDVYR